MQVKTSMSHWRSHLNRVGLAFGFLATVSWIAFAQVPGGQRLQLSPPSDGGLRIPEFVVGGPGSLQGFAGLATIWNGAPVIFYDPAWIQQFGGVGSPAFRFTRAHEYAHHRRGHATAQFTTPPQFLPMLGYQSELEADCIAVRVLKRAGDHQAIKAGFQIYQQVLTPFDSQGRPGAVVRTDNMQACLR
jgi:hypothetical protein